MAAVGTGLTMGGAAGGGSGRRLDRTDGGGGDVAAAQATHRAGLAGGSGVTRWPAEGSDLPDAVLGVHRPGTRADAAIPGRPGVGARPTGRGGPDRPEPAFVALAGRVPRRTVAVITAAAAVLAASLISTGTFRTSWQDNPTKAYLQNAVRDLAVARDRSAEPMLDQEVDPLILQRVVGPESLASHMFALIHDRPEFARSTGLLRMLDSSGHVVDADVTWLRRIAAGPRPQCGYFVGPDEPARMPLDGPLLPAEWTAEINYPGQHRRRHIAVAAGRPGDPGAGQAGAEPGIRPVVRCRRRRHGAGRDSGVDGVRGIRPGGLPGTPRLVRQQFVADLKCPVGRLGTPVAGDQRQPVFARNCGYQSVVHRASGQSGGGELSQQLGQIPVHQEAGVREVDLAQTQRGRRGEAGAAAAATG